MAGLPGISRYSAYGIAAIVLLGGMGARGAEPRALERQTREFRISVDGKPRGKCTMRIHEHDDGRHTLKVESALSFNYVVYTYRYSSAGTEVWKDDRLVELENVSDFNGTKYLVQAGPEKRGLTVKVNGKGAPAVSHAWVTSYWRLPDHLAAAEDEASRGVVQAAATSESEKPAPKHVALVDSDKGRVLKARLHRVGHELVHVGEKQVKCTRYRLSGDVQVDLWYDAARRLVRQESVEEGHKTRLELMKISTEAAHPSKK